VWDQPPRRDANQERGKLNETGKGRRLGVGPFFVFGGIEPGQRASRQRPRAGASGGGGDFELLQGTNH